MIYAVKKDGESNERLMSRFKKVVQRSRLMMTSKQRKYYVHEDKKGKVRQKAIKREFYRGKRAKQQYYSD